ncbi:MAG: DEAD/DEAH box helicase family protein [Clostridia bacterium]
MTLQLRPYQSQAISDLFEYWATNKGRSPLIVLPTGAGKSLVVASFIKTVLDESPYVHIMVLAHVRELVQQNHDEFVALCPEISTGIYSAGLNSRDTKNSVIFAGIQSIYNKVYSLPHKIDIVIIDEAHSISPKETTRYGRFIKDMKVANPNVVIWGATATPFRTTEGLLTDGKDRLFDGIAHCTDLKDLIRDGYLVPIVSKSGVKKIDLTNVHIQAGEYNQRELAHAANDKELVRLAVEEFVEYGKTRRAWIVYCSGVAHAEHVAQEIRKHGVECKVLTGNTKTEERDKIVNDFKNGKLKCICNVGVLTTGFNAPITDMIVLLFSTISTGKYIQVVGRGARNYSENNGYKKTECVLLDYGENVLKHGLLDEIDVQRTKDVFGKEKIKPPMKECPNPKCKAIIHARVMKCPSCGYEFPLPEAEAKHGTEAYSGPVTSDQVKPFIVDVVSTYVAKHAKPGKTPSVRMEFIDRMDRSYPIWFCLDHKNYAAEKARALVNQFGGKARSVDEALKEYPNWRQVEKIEVRPDGRFFRVNGFVFKKGQSTQQKLEG